MCAIKRKIYKKLTMMAFPIELYEQYDLHSKYVHLHLVVPPNQEAMHHYFRSLHLNSKSLFIYNYVM